MTSSSPSEDEAEKPVPRATTITWANMVGCDRAKRGWGAPRLDCGLCIHFDPKKGNKALGNNIGGCNLHSFIPYTTNNNVCDMIEKK